MDKTEYYMVGYDGSSWGGYETVDEAREHAENEKKLQPDKDVFIKRVIELEEIVETL